MHNRTCKLVAWVKALRPFGRRYLDIVRRSGKAAGFKLLPKRGMGFAGLRFAPAAERTHSTSLRAGSSAGWSSPAACASTTKSKPPIAKP